MIRLSTIKKWCICLNVHSIPNDFKVSLMYSFPVVQEKILMVISIIREFWMDKIYISWPAAILTPDDRFFLIKSHTLNSFKIFKKQV